MGTFNRGNTPCFRPFSDYLEDDNPALSLREKPYDGLALPPL
jgi:hypothetical protein